MIPVFDLFIKSAIASIFWSFLAALILQFSTKWQANFKPSYKKAYMLTFFSSLMVIFFSLTVAFVIFWYDKPTTLAAHGLTQGKIGLISIVTGFIIQSHIYGTSIEHPEKGYIGFKKGCAISFNQIIISVAVLGIIFWALSFLSHAFS